jgi:hypothetical protein
MRSLIRSLIVVGGGAAILFAQLQVIYWDWQLHSEIGVLNYGTGLLSVMLIGSLWGILSGVVFGLILSIKHADAPTRRRIFWYAALFGLVPVITLIIRMAIVAGRNFLFLQNDELWDWLVYSPVPAFWTGIILGWITRQLLPWQEL